MLMSSSPFERMGRSQGGENGLLFAGASFVRGPKSAPGYKRLRDI